ncbi:MAG: DUF1700 domain-containing protein [Clostridiales bacterium]|nr:DUF1700 domain-containing protein [Clostridiales bacterium]
MDAQMKRGMIEICILSLLAKGDSYGYQLIKDIGPILEISESTLYPVLRRLESASCLTVYSVEHNSRLRKYYAITEEGRKKIAGFLEEWKEIYKIYQFISQASEEAKEAFAMTRKEYMDALAEALSFLSEEARDAALAFYDEMMEDSIEDGMTEEEAVAAMESVEDIAAKLRDEEGKPEEKKENSGAWTYEEKKAVYPASSLNAIRIRARDCAIRFFPAQDDQITLIYHTCKEDPYALSCQDGLLSLECQSAHRSWQKGFSFSFQGGFQINWKASGPPPIALHIPVDALLDLDLGTQNSAIRGEGLSALCAVTLATSNARISLENMSCKSLQLQSSNARLELINVSAKQFIQGDTSNGRIEASKVSAAEELTLTTSNGRFQAEEISVKGLLNFTTSNGNIALQCIQAGEIRLRTSNGKIQGALPGKQADWAIESATSNGKNNLPKHQAGAKPLTVRTSNGNINLLFEE